MASDDLDAWQCPTCTLINPMHSNKCDACHNARPTGYEQLHEASPPPPPKAAAPPPPKAVTPVSSHAKAPGPSNAKAASVQNTRSQQIGLSAEQRAARAEEMAAKRRKKEEEQERILRQAEADRQARLAYKTPTAEAPAAAASATAATQSPAPAVASSSASTASQGPQPVRLQIRCPHWNRVIVYTCFTNDTTLGDVRHCLRDELITGIMSTGDGRLHVNDELPEGRQLTEEQMEMRQARENFRQQTQRMLEASANQRKSQVPPEDSIVLVEAVPPRRRWVSAQDMQITLQAAGLCPSSTLLAEAPPVGDASNGPDSNAPGVQNDEPHRRHERDEEEIEEDSDEGEDGPPMGMPGGRGMMIEPMGNVGGSGTFGGAPNRMYGGTFNANWRFGPRQTRPTPGGARIGQGGQILGGADTEGQNVEGQTAQTNANAGGGSSAPSDAAAARAARLAALERRGLGAAQEAPEAAPAKPAPQMTDAGSTKQKKEAEKARILREIAEEREEFARRNAPVPKAQAEAAPAPELSQENAELRAAAAEAAQRRMQGSAVPTAKSPAAGPSAAPAAGPSTAPAALTPAPAMGGSTMKKRLEERQQILQQLEEDRNRYAELHVPAPSTSERRGPSPSPQVLEARAIVGSQASSDAVRLQIRCARSGRTITTTAFDAQSPLEAVVDFASAEFGLASPDRAFLSLAFPPRTIFESPEQLTAGLGSLGLCPTATLILHPPKADDSTEEAQPMDEEPAVVSAPPPPADVVQPALDRTVSAQERAEQRARAALERLTCPQTEPPAASQAAVSSIQEDPAPAPLGENEAQLRIRLPDGTMVRRRFARDATAATVVAAIVAEFLEASNSTGDGGWVMGIPFPRRTLGEAELVQTLEELDLAPHGTVVIQHGSQVGQVLHGRTPFLARRRQASDGAMGDDEFREWVDGRDWDDDVPHMNRSQNALDALVDRFQVWSFNSTNEADSAAAESAAAATATAKGDLDHTDRISCVICCCEYSSGDRLLCLPCGHSFHRDCVVRWLRRSSDCPCCRKTVD